MKLWKRITAAATLTVSLAAPLGCTQSQQQITAQAITLAGKTAAAIEAQQGNVAIGNKILADSAAAAAAYANWVPGTPAQNVEYLLNVLADDLNLLPIPAEYTDVITGVIEGINTILEGLPAPALTPSNPVPAVNPAVYRISMAEFMHVAPKPRTQKTLSKADVKKLRKQFQDVLKKHPELAKKVAELK